VGANVGGVRKIAENPQTQELGVMYESYEGEIRNLPKIVLASKDVNTFTHALTPPFIGRRRDFYIPKIPSNLGHIPSVSMYMNVFYIP
jgi:hypothetical protein